ncbi:MAG: rhodanese-like domain-containing protein, partial [Xanthobacteraceae bacterium]
MAQTITRGIKKLLAEANNEIETMNVADAKAAVARGEAVIVDIRDPRELEREG